MEKYIVTHSIEYDDGHVAYYSNGVIIASTYNHSIKLYQNLLEEVQKSFPELTESQVECRTVVESRWCKGLPMLFFPLKPQTIAEGWRNVSELPDVKYA